MKFSKLFLTSVLAIGFAAPAMATGQPGDPVTTTNNGATADCDNNLEFDPAGAYPACDGTITPVFEKGLYMFCNDAKTTVPDTDFYKLFVWDNFGNLIVYPSAADATGGTNPLNPSDFKYNYQVAVDNGSGSSSATVDDTYGVIGTSNSAKVECGKCFYTYTQIRCGYYDNGGNFTSAGTYTTTVGNSTTVVWPRDPSTGDELDVDIYCVPDWQNDPTAQWTVNYTDASGGSTTGTCSVGGNISLPTTINGRRVAGWKVQ